MRGSSTVMLLFVLWTCWSASACKRAEKTEKDAGNQSATVKGGPTDAATTDAPTDACTPRAWFSGDCAVRAKNEPMDAPADAAFEVLDIRCDREHGLGFCLESRPTPGEPGEKVLEYDDVNRVFAWNVTIDATGRVWARMEKPRWTETRTERVGRIQRVLMDRVRVMVRDAFEGPETTRRFEGPDNEPSTQAWLAYFEGARYPLRDTIYELRAHTLHRRTCPSALALIRLLDDVRAAAYLAWYAEPRVRSKGKGR